jgi:hypothetical protein
MFFSYIYIYIYVHVFFQLMNTNRGIRIQPSICNSMLLLPLVQCHYSYLWLSIGAYLPRLYTRCRLLCYIGFMMGDVVAKTGM